MTADQNGPGSADTETTYFNRLGQAIWRMDAEGFLHYTAYDPATGAVVKTIVDVATTETDDFTNLPSGWQTHEDAKEHLVTEMTVDALGRTTRLITPEGKFNYIVYKDAQHEVRTYVGLYFDEATSSYKTTLPIQVTRYDPSTGCTESFTLALPPHMTVDGLDGKDGVWNVQTLSRTYTDLGGHVIHEDRSFNVKDLAQGGTIRARGQNVNFYRTETAYAFGLPVRVISPTNNVTRLVYDKLNRCVGQVEFCHRKLGPAAVQ